LFFPFFDVAVTCDKPRHF